MSGRAGERESGRAGEKAAVNEAGNYPSTPGDDADDAGRAGALPSCRAPPDSLSLKIG